MLIRRDMSPILCDERLPIHLTYLQSSELIQDHLASQILAFILLTLIGEPRFVNHEAAVQMIEI
jgi:hypothetical protein